MYRWEIVYSNDRHADAGLPRSWDEKQTEAGPALAEPWCIGGIAALSLESDVGGSGVTRFDVWEISTGERVGVIPFDCTGAFGPCR